MGVEEIRLSSPTNNNNNNILREYRNMYIIYRNCLLLSIYINIIYCGVVSVLLRYVGTIILYEYA